MSTPQHRDYPYPADMSEKVGADVTSAAEVLAWLEARSR
jgi:hypothetical protein